MIVAEHVSKYYGAHAAVADISFTIQSGEVVGLLGLNGAGKTTTLRILSGLLLPTAGKVSIAGLDMVENPEAVRSRIGFLPETPPLYTEMRVAEFLRFVANIRGVHKNVQSFVDDALNAADLQNVRDQVIGTLSHGYRRRVGIAQAVVHKPDLILLDEPTSGLDPVQVVQMRSLIRNLQKKHTVMVSSHILSEIHQMCDRILVLQAGRIAAVGTESELAGQVTGGTNVTIEIAATKAQLEQALAGFAAVRKLNVEHEEPGLVRATIELSSDVRAELAQKLVAAKIGLLRLERVHMELESIFLKLTSSQNTAPTVVGGERAA